MVKHDSLSSYLPSCLFYDQDINVWGLEPVEADDDVVLELDVPQYVQPDDVRVLFQPWGIEVGVIGHVSLWRTYWRDGFIFLFIFISFLMVKPVGVICATCSMNCNWIGVAGD